MIYESLNKRFKHHKWFTKSNVTIKEALDYFAKSDFYLDKKKSRKQSENLFDPIKYDEVLRSSDYRDRATYKVNQIEKAYFLERVKYWEQKRKEDYELWLDSIIDVDEELKIYLASNSNYDLKYVERQLHYWKHEDKDNEIDTIKYWEKELHRRTITKKIIDNMIIKYKNTIKTNRDFIEFKDMINRELNKIQYWDEDEADYILREENTV